MLCDLKKPEQISKTSSDYVTPNIQHELNNRDGFIFQPVFAILSGISALPIRRYSSCALPVGSQDQRMKNFTPSIYLAPICDL